MLQIWISCGGRRDANQTGFQLAVAHDLLGWKNFVDGCQEEFIVSRPSNQQRSRKSSAKWASGFVDMIIQITHRQWLNRNEKLHYTQHFGVESPREDQRIMARIKHLHYHTDPDDLLPADQYLLAENLDTVASWTVTRRQIWTAEFEASLAACTTIPYTQTETKLPAVRPRPTESQRKTEEKEERGKEVQSTETNPRAHLEPEIWHLAWYFSYSGVRFRVTWRNNPPLRRHEMREQSRVGGTYAAPRVLEIVGSFCLGWTVFVHPAQSPNEIDWKNLWLLEGVFIGPSFAPADASCHECISLGAHDAQPSGVPRPPARPPPTPGGPPSDSPRGANDEPADRAMDREAIVCASAEKARAAPPPAVLLRATPTRESTLAPSTWDCYSTALQVIRMSQSSPSVGRDDFGDARCAIRAERHVGERRIDQTGLAQVRWPPPRTAASSPSQGDSHQRVDAGSFDLGLLLHSSPSHQESRNRAFGNQRLRRHAPALGARIDCSDGECHNHHRASDETTLVTPDARYVPRGTWENDG
ncbi:hypothetical protein THAOC_15825 [Thalassiosira oceanica]|uniref:Uncharacterized protein n=1 Tax=Thalassiosira oceanica TaxID=159749 RepID=K0SDN8_THAOC|nr:hypothetical protein THAOC_15825 [Thalassiosira oceanica]|eukprot:EJK63510.1 hypothetical protein THAOC_15825 [Thalassiosira oceanica]